MKLTLVPETHSPRSTISRLFVNGVFECFVLEPPDPIPAGTYEIMLQHSQRFDRRMPFLQNVPGHTAIEIHFGNTVADTRDCLLVGQTVGPDFVGHSVDAFTALFAKLEATSPITIEITRQAILPVAPPVEELKGALPMADPATAATKPPLLTNHAPVTVYYISASAAGLIIAVLKAKWSIDFSGQEINLCNLIGGIAGYITKGSIG